MSTGSEDAPDAVAPASPERIQGAAGASARGESPTPSTNPAHPAEDPPQLEALGFQVLSHLGQGVVGDVWLVRDPKLNRPMAVKVLRAEWQHNEGIVQRFVAEAQATAQLEHPGIVPVHALSQLPDGRPCFAMKEVRGRTLTEVIAQHHSSPDAAHIRRLIDVFHRICDAVAYAHARGVLHRDLKPSNIMIGGYGEVLVLDWGLARTGHAPEPVVTARSSTDAQATHQGTVSGTPAYMPPEQARGRRLELTADVYALGAILYEILTGRPPYEGVSAIGVLAQVVSKPPPPPRARAPHPLPPELEDICLRAIARVPADRFADAGGLAAAIGRWLDGARRREKALALVEEARETAGAAERMRREATLALEAARSGLADLPALALPEEKWTLWEQEDRALEQMRQVGILEVSMQQKLGAAMAEEPQLPEAHAELADYYQRRHAEAEDAGNTNDAARLEALLRTHDRGRHAAWLRAEGRVTLRTVPPGADIGIFRFVSRGRRLEPEPFLPPKSDVLTDFSLPIGSYLLKVRNTGRAEVRIPVAIGRLEHWDGVPPGHVESYPIRLPEVQEATPESCYVPAGWFVAGGDRRAVRSISRQRVWVDGFFIHRFPVTHGQYLEFLNDLVNRGRTEEATRAAPYLRTARHGQEPEWIYGRSAAGHYELKIDAEGDTFSIDEPVVTVSWQGARAYAAWYAARTGLPWRLPLELEREKAGRGVDERIFPWGNHFDLNFCCIRDSHRGRPRPRSIHEFSLDESPYGVRGLAGNTRDWCLDTWDLHHARVEGDRAVFPPEDAPPETWRTVRGGAWSSGELMPRLCSRTGEAPDRTSYHVGLRLVRSWG